MKKKRTGMKGGNHWIVNGHAGICNEVCMDFQNRRNYSCVHVFMLKEVVYKE